MQIHRHHIVAANLPARSALPLDAAPLRVPAKPAWRQAPRWWFVLARGVSPVHALRAAG